MGSVGFEPTVSTGIDEPEIQYYHFQLPNVAFIFRYETSRDWSTIPLSLNRGTPTCLTCYPSNKTKALTSNGFRANALGRCLLGRVLFLFALNSIKVFWEIIKKGRGLVFVFQIISWAARSRLLSSFVHVKSKSKRYTNKQKVIKVGGIGFLLVQARGLVK